MRTFKQIAALFGLLVFVMVGFGVAQHTSTLSVDRPLVQKRADDFLGLIKTDPYTQSENTQGRMTKSTLADTTRLDSLTLGFDRSWLMDVKRKVHIDVNYDSVFFNITVKGPGAAPIGDKGLVLRRTYTTYVTDFVPGLDIWFERSDSIGTGDRTDIHFLHRTWQRENPTVRTREIPLYNNRWEE